MEADSVFVTGANRGIGLEFVKQFVKLPKPPKHIFATYRSEASLKDLQDVKESSKRSEVILIKMDVTKTDEIAAARKIIEQHIGDAGLSLLINNARVAEVATFPNLTPDKKMSFHFTTNAVGPVTVFEEMLPLLEKPALGKASAQEMSVSKAAVLNVRSLGGSITRPGKEFLMDLVVSAYKISKAELDMAIRIRTVNYKEKEILVIHICPGWVSTDMGTEKSEMSTEESISTMLETLPNLDSSSRSLHGLNGKSLPILSEMNSPTILN